MRRNDCRGIPAPVGVLRDKEASQSSQQQERGKGNASKEDRARREKPPRFFPLMFSTIWHCHAVVKTEGRFRNRASGSGL